MNGRQNTKSCDITGQENGLLSTTLDNFIRTITFNYYISLLFLLLIIFLIVSYSFSCANFLFAGWFVGLSIYLFILFFFSNLTTLHIFHFNIFFIFLSYSPIPSLTLIFPAGDELLSVNGVVMQGLTHRQASRVFKTIRQGQVLCYVARRVLER